MADLDRRQPEDTAPDATAWALALAAARHARAAAAAPGRYVLADGGLRRVDTGGELERDAAGRWLPVAHPGREPAVVLDLYLPLCSACAGAPVTVAHLGQSLDGYVATSGGDSSYVNSPENILHLHRMRALCDAVVVGAGTVAADDPRLTTRLAAGPNPVRVVLDPRRRLAASHRVFTDGAAETILVCGEECAGEERVGAAAVLGVPCPDGRLDLAALLERLHARGLYSVFVEGGGTTVSRFLEAGLLDRLQVAIAPLITGRGRPGLRLPGQDRLAACLRPQHRIFAMGTDLLFDCVLAGGDGAQSIRRAALRRL